MKKLLLTTLTVFAISSANAGAGVALSGSQNWGASNNACVIAVGAANAENKKAKKADFEWRDTGKMIKAAGKAGGDKCVAIAAAAKEQALDAQQQAKDQANAGPQNHGIKINLF